MFRKDQIKTEIISLKDSFRKNSLILSLSLFFFLYGLTVIIDFFFQLNIKIIVPIFNEIGNEYRILMFVLMIPFAFTYFLVENILFFSFTSAKKLSLNKLLLAKITPFVIMVMLLYLPILIFSTAIIPGITGFFVEFLDPIIPLFVFTTAINWMLYSETKEIWSATFVNSLLITWVMASLFPLI